MHRRKHVSPECLVPDDEVSALQGIELGQILGNATDAPDISVRSCTDGATLPFVQRLPYFSAPNRNSCPDANTIWFPFV